MPEKRRPHVLTPAGCNKVGFESEREARNAAKGQRRRPGMHGLYPYQCCREGCDRWHLTHRKELGW